MRDVQWIARYIDATISDCIRFPGGGYQLPPHAMEIHLMVLDSIRILLIDAGAESPALLLDYPQFLCNAGFGTLRVTTHLLPKPELTSVELTALEKLNAVWHEYLTQTKRLVVRDEKH